jgi:predicted DNA-binding protein
MTRKASTFRIEARLQTALKTLSKIARRPVNRVVNEAVEAYLRQHGPEAERDLEASLASLRAYR